MLLSRENHNTNINVNVELQTFLFPSLISKKANVFVDDMMSPAAWISCSSALSLGLENNRVPDVMYLAFL